MTAFDTAWQLLKQDAPEYQGHHQAPIDEDYHAPLHDMTRIYPEDLYSDMGVHYYGDGSHESREMDRYSHGIIMGVRGDPEANVIVYRTVPHEVEGEINGGIGFEDSVVDLLGPKKWDHLDPSDHSRQGLCQPPSVRITRRTATL